MKQMSKFFNHENLWFVAIFTVLGLIALQVPFTKLVGSQVKFTLFDFFGPIATGFIGLIPGVVSVFLMQFVNFLIHGAEVIDVGTVIRFFPMLFAAAYFGKKASWNIVVPAIAIAAFIANPIGRQAWYFSLYWLIPIIMYFYRDKFLLARSLGATFTAHAVGGAAWVWAFGLTKEIWIGLIPIVAMERLLMAVGISVSYVVVSNVLAYLLKKKIISLPFNLDSKYLLKPVQ
ncbi:MAG: hypothetical protein COT81_04120 [Candidatus Buchananbacteria bacterium CG10_big_fil_rev_8_21_14_0_10_42_9]|uniref:ECF transporter S component n=1 Tax=Candidatus Buchananbacteria bacterium CG10_big_fil_rev_8_21_14_0_10_42_9 TaxID=1974526 RepID=A0A2H0W300_9BACT|nr:MAG: hypothetical protein COT81_04120 [Candidatus Buchananbacteria bacterium CG10_big_fil_rev_8_21_14_0_10_42_9]